ncbi:uncharacterized protein LOC100842562 [Brachypodium distachyon]|uniref:DUF295 domain-containing protein n=1 Tax=Brachypodium distachyon TaxID=15368 RepID=I1I5G6_BRADI|nr:uncharacterized protein LOC100842562 [Brachypodium distachyon]XP_024316427.1 uncharacterized protein LOC100842562 [Brachypodium distachyon]KQJ97488.1 hypothetical protein BRADI_3g31350v3 [Brachypodium distachyon]|eukprot:XP_003571976.1 uncharacterized protein LOC100842562 [Brachypodium distachyon]
MTSTGSPGARRRRHGCASVATDGASRDWSSLPAELLLCVFALLLSDADRVRFRAVCRRWASAAGAWRPRPWLVGSRTDRSGQGAATSSFWLSRAGRLLPFPAEIPPGLEYLSSSSHGYLVLSDPSRAGPGGGKAITLLNPSTGRRVPLPPIGFFKKWHDVHTVVLSADPAMSGGGEWTAVASAFPANCLAYYCSAAGVWTALNFRVTGYVGVEHFRGRFYVAFKRNIYVLVHDLNQRGGQPVLPLGDAVEGDFPGAGGRKDYDFPGGRASAVDTHLVESEGQLLLVWVRGGDGYSSDDDLRDYDNVIVGDDDELEVVTRSNNRRTVEVHRVELVGDGAVRLEPVYSLGAGRCALFLGRNRAFTLSPAEFPACRANCVYLLDRQGHPNGVVTVLNVERSCKETIYPEEGLRGWTSAGWARRGWFFANY